MSCQTKHTSIWDEEIRLLKNRGLYRVMPQVSGLPGRIISVNGQRVLNFSSNNYLGLAAHSKILEAVARYTNLFGAGATASRLIAGNNQIHRELEEFIAKWKGTESAVLFGSGYQANIGVLTALTGESDLILSDELNHASIIDGCKLSKARVVVYRHLDLNSLEDGLVASGFRRKLVVTESVFSMDGDFAPLREISYLCNRYGAILMVDEAHATGIIGPKGQGLAAEMGITPDIQMGTLGKAVGTSGAYIAGSKGLVDLLTNKARSLIYTTGAPPGVVGSALTALQIISSAEGDMRRRRLRDNVNMFAKLMNKAGIVTLPSHIVPVLIGESSKTMRVSTMCLEHGIYAHGIRHPSVPEGTARLRFTLMSDHTVADLEKAVSVLSGALEYLHSGYLLEKNQHNKFETSLAFRRQY